MGDGFIYSRPPPFNEASPLLEKQDVLSEYLCVIAKKGADRRDNPFPIVDWPCVFL
ncbi:MAG: hypothetical protein IJ941_03295 [Clostridia bacterium]|nr:hypothetical protein [Clostridia bacterium]